MGTSDFQYKFLAGLIHDCFEHQIKNTDYLRFNMRFLDRTKSHFEDICFLLLKKLGLVHCHFDMEKAKASLLVYAHNMDKLEYVYRLLGDDYSKNLFVQLLKLRILNTRHVRLPVNNKSFWRMYHSVDKKYLRERATMDTGRFLLDTYNIHGLNGPMRVHATSLGILAVFLLEQYAYKKLDGDIGAGSGDAVIDGGACWGETSLYFADKVGPDGKVYAFEFVEGNVRVLEKNIGSNLHLRDRVELIKNALWNVSGESLSYSERGPSTSVLSVKGMERHLKKVRTVTIDDFVKEKGIHRVDFIKMDIEGAELKALLGAEETIKRFTPKLAISIYHNDEDFFEIPRAIHELNREYEYYLDHFTIHNEETVLFCRPKGN